MIWDPNLGKVRKYPYALLTIGHSKGSRPIKPSILLGTKNDRNKRCCQCAVRKSLRGIAKISLAMKLNKLA
jgi:hypothetical protein